LEVEKEALSEKIEEALMQQSKKHKVLLLFARKTGSDLNHGVRWE